MKILHILRSEPDEMIRMFIRETSAAAEPIEFPLYQENVDYDELVEKIFASDRVICWWQ